MKSVLAVSLACVLALAAVSTAALARQTQADGREASIRETLRSPQPATQIGVRLAAFTLKDPAADKLRLLIACEIDRTVSPAGTIALGYTLTNEAGTAVVSRFEREVTDPLKGRTQTYFDSAAADPGVYTLKLAVIDEAGKRGSAQRTIRAQLTDAGAVKSGDLIIADKAAGETSQRPSVSADIAGDTLLGYVEVYSDASEALASMTAEIEVAGSEDGRAIERSWLRFRDAPAAQPNRRVGEGTVLLAFLQPGPYVARAVISAGGRRVGQVTQRFRVVRASANTTAGVLEPRPAATPATEAPAPTATAATTIVSRPDVFERTVVLTPGVLSFFLDKLAAGRRGAPTPPAVEEAARAGRFDAALDAAKGTAASPLAMAFLSGLSLYSKGELEDAAKQFRESLRLDSEFFPAAFYLGACYAAGGRDGEAAGAWQTSLISLNDAPFVYTLIADAFLRLRQYDSALDILGDASERWPNDGGHQVRRGMALAGSGKRHEALDLLDTYLAKHPEDHLALVAAMRAIYDAHASGQPIATAADDRQRFDRYAAAYAAARGPEQALVAQWKKAMAR